MKQHEGNAVKCIIFRCKGDRLAGAVPVERRIEYRLGEVGVGHEVRPHSLTLETAEDGVSALCFLKPTHFFQLFVAVEDILYDAGHLRDELPVLLLFLCGEDGAHICHALGGVDVDAFGALFLYPCESLLVFGFVVDTELFAADDFGHIHPFGVNAEVAAEEILVAVCAGDAHCLRADVNVALVLHIADSRRAACEAEYLLLNVRGDNGIVRVLYIVAVDGEAGHSYLRVCRICRREEYRAGALGAVETPYSLDGGGVLVDYLRYIAPAGCDGEGGGDVLAGEFVRAGCAFRNAADGVVRDDALNGGAVGVAHLACDKLRGCLCHVHGLLLEGFADTELSAVNDGSDAYFY